MPLRVEHNTQPVGSVLSAWTASDGSLYALAEIDVKVLYGHSMATLWPPCSPPLQSPLWIRHNNALE